MYFSIDLVIEKIGKYSIIKLIASYVDQADRMEQKMSKETHDTLTPWVQNIGLVLHHNIAHHDLAVEMKVLQTSDA
jgi:hypothetical protein